MRFYTAILAFLSATLVAAAPVEVAAREAAADPKAQYGDYGNYGDYGSYGDETPAYGAYGEYGSYGAYKREANAEAEPVAEAAE